MYAIEDRFFDEVQDIAEHLEYEFLINQDDSFTVEAYECDLEKIGVLDADELTDRAFDEERFSEDQDEKDKICKIFIENIDFDKINASLPSLWYPSNRKVVFTKAELIDSIKDYQ